MISFALRCKADGPGGSRRYLTTDYARSTGHGLYAELKHARLFDEELQAADRMLAMKYKYDWRVVPVLVEGLVRREMQ